MSESRSTETAMQVRERRWLGPALLVSLIINLFLLGMIATALIFHRPPPGDEFGPVPSPFFRMLQKDMGGRRPDDRAVVRSIMIQQFPIIRPYIVKIEIARRDLAQAIGATPYDPAKVSAAFERVDQAQAEMIRATRDAMVQGFGKLDPAQRERLAETMRKQAERRITNKGSEDGPPPPPDGEGPPRP